MAHIVFWEKPGCAGNARQIALLQASGHTLDVRSLLRERWRPEELRAFFGERPVSEWFNRSAPRVKSGEIQPENTGEAQALSLMLSDPLLIRRPLMESGDRREAGFEPERIKAWIGLAEPRVPVTDSCLRETSRVEGGTPVCTP